MSDLVFAFTGDRVRSTLIDQDPWFHLGDVCKILGFKNPSQTIAPLFDENKRKIESVSGVDPWFIDEEALWTIMLRSNGALDPESVAYKFRKWVVSVIKSIRTTGGYISPEATPEQVQTLFSTYQAKLTECDRQILNAELGAGKISKLAADRRTLETLVRKESAASNKPISGQAALGNLLQAWYKVHGTKPMTGQEVIEAATEGCNAALKAALIDCASDQSGKISAKSLGYYLRANAGNRVDEMRIVKVKTTRRGLICWGIEI